MKLKRGVQEFLNTRKNRPIKIIGISSSNRSRHDCAREDPISLQILKISLKEAEKSGAKTELIELNKLKIGECKECYSSCPAQCRFNEKLNMCDCYPRKNPSVFLDDGKFFSLEDAYDKMGKIQFIQHLQDKNFYDEGDEMWKIYKALMEADGIIFAGFTNYYSRPALLQKMFSRLCALDGGVEELWGDGKNLSNSIKFSRNKNMRYKQRLYGKFAGFIISSKEGDSVTPTLMKACTMMGMRIIPFSVSYVVNWYSDPTHRSDMKKSLSDSYSINLAKNLGKRIVSEIKNSDRNYGIYSSRV